MAGLLGGFTPGPGPAGPSLHVGVSLRRDTRPATWPERRLARFRWGGGDAYEDRCELWTAHLRGFDAALEATPPAALEATALVSSRATDPVLWTRAGVLLARVAAASALPRRGGLLLHGCAMVPPGAAEATVFVGASGEGKTTMTRRLAGWRVLADDTVVVWSDEEAGGFRVAGTPFAGKERLPRDGRSVPLARLVLLAPGAAAASFEEVRRGDAFRAVTARVMCFADRGPLVERTLQVTDRLVGVVGVWRLASSLEHDVAGLLEADGTPGGAGGR